MIRGEIWWTDPGLPFGSEQGFKRPVVILQNNSFYKSKIRTTVVLLISTNMLLADASENVLLKKEKSRLPKDGIINVSQISTIDKLRLIKKIGTINITTEERIDAGFKLVLGLDL